MIKKCCHWPKYIDGSVIQALMKDKQVGYQARLPGEVDCVGVDIFSMKEPDYTMMSMSTYGQLVVKEGLRENIKHVEDPATGE